MKFVHHEIRINKQKATLVISNGVFYDMKHEGCSLTNPVLYAYHLWVISISFLD